jgi:hypothetical protein
MSVSKRVPFNDLPEALLLLAHKKIIWNGNAYSYSLLREGINE